MGKPVKPLRQGQAITEGWIAALVSEIRRLGKLSATPPLRITSNDSGIAITMDPGLDIIRFRLIESLSAGGEADAMLTIWSVDDEDWIDAGAEGGENQIVVTDGINSIAGEENTPGYAFWHMQSGKWLILQLACSAPEE